MTGWKQSTRRPPLPQDDNLDDVDEHRNGDDGDDDNNHRETLETNAGESNRANKKQDSPAFAVKAIRQFNANVIVCHLMTRDRRWYIVGCYLEPFNNKTIRYVEAVMVEWPSGADLIFAGDLNLDLERTGGWVLDEEITAAVETVGIEDISAKFLP